MTSTWVNVTDVVFPPMDQINFSSACTSYGQWLTGLTTPNPWEPSQSLGGSIELSIAYMLEALGPNWVHPDPNVTDYIMYSQCVQFMTDNLYWTYDEDERLWDSNPVWLKYVMDVPQEKCPDEFCKALGRTGNADLTGIGVSSATCHESEEIIFC